MTLSTELDAQGGLESISRAERVASLTGIRAVAAILVMATHAAYATGKYSHGYVGLVYSRMEIGVPIFFVLSGFLLFGPWVKAVATDGPAPSVRRYAWHRVRRIMPAYVVTVLVAQDVERSVAEVSVGAVLGAMTSGLMHWGATPPSPDGPMLADALATALDVLGPRP